MCVSTYSVSELYVWPYTAMERDQAWPKSGKKNWNWMNLTNWSSKHRILPKA